MGKRKYKRMVRVKVNLEYEVYRILKERFGGITEPVNKALELFLQQSNAQTQQIPKEAVAMGRGFSSGNFTQVVNTTSGKVEKCESVDQDFLIKKGIWEKTSIQASLGTALWLIGQMKEYFATIVNNFSVGIVNNKAITQFDLKLQGLRKTIANCQQLIQLIPLELHKTVELMASVVNDIKLGKTYKDIQIRQIEIERLWKKWKQQQEKEMN